MCNEKLTKDPTLSGKVALLRPWPLEAKAKALSDPAFHWFLDCQRFVWNEVRQEAPNEPEFMNEATFEEKLALGLGWFSIGLGVAELLAPQKISKGIGIKAKPSLIRSFGAREIGTGIGILTRKKTGAWLWGRVAGDAVDLACLGAALASKKSRNGRIALAAAAVAGVAVADVIAARRMSTHDQLGTKKIHIRQTVIIDRPAAELFDFWRHFDRLPIIMNHLESVEKIDENRSHWVVKAPAGKHVEWDAEIINEHPNELIAWRSLEGADVENAGTVRFEPAPGGRGTIVKVDLEFVPPGGVIGAMIAKLFAEHPEKQISVDLRRFKQLMETGEIARTEGQPAGRLRSTSKKYDDFVRT